MGKPSQLLDFLIKQRNVQIAELAAGADVYPSTVYRHLAGSPEPTLKSRRAYAKVFGMTLDQFDAMWLNNAYPQPPDASEQPDPAQTQARGETSPSVPRVPTLDELVAQVRAYAKAQNLSLREATAQISDTLNVRAPRTVDPQSTAAPSAALPPTGSTRSKRPADRGR